MAKKPHYAGAQWNVTVAGIECTSRNYNVRKEDLRMNMGAGGWVEHMAEKNWVDVADFKRAYEIALKIHK